MRASYLVAGGSTRQLACVIGALGRGIHIPPMRLVVWPLQLVGVPALPDVRVGARVGRGRGARLAGL